MENEINKNRVGIKAIYSINELASLHRGSGTTLLQFVALMISVLVNFMSLLDCCNYCVNYLNCKSMLTSSVSTKRLPQSAHYIQACVGRT